MTDQTTDKGIIEAADRILSQLLQNPSVKSSLRILLTHIDASSSRGLVRTVLWQDMEVAMAFMAAAPSLGNALIHLVDELLDQMNDKFPEAMLAGYLENTLEEIDRETLAQARVKARSLIDTLYPVIEKTLLSPEADGAETSQPGAASGPAAVPDPVYPSAAADEAAGPAPQGEGVLAEILKTPLFKDILREVLKSVDGRRGRAAARALLWEDMETAFAIMGALPPIINFYINLVAELGEQLADKIPPRLFIGFVTDVLSDIDVAAARQGARTYRELGRSLLEEGGLDLDAHLHDWLTDPALGKTLAGAVNQGLAWINRVENSHPGTLRQMMSGIVESTDRAELDRSARHVTEAVLAQKPPFFTLAWRTIKLYVGSWFRRTP